MKYATYIKVLLTQTLCRDEHWPLKYFGLARSHTETKRGGSCAFSLKNAAAGKY